MYVRALRIGFGAFLSHVLAYLHVELYRNLLGRITRIVITRLVFKFSMDGVSAKRRFRLRNDHGLNHHISRVNTQLLGGIKRKAGQLPCRILDFCNYEVRWRREAQGGGNQLRRCRLVGIDVISALDVKGELQGSVLPLFDHNSVQRFEVNVTAALCRGASLLSKKRPAQQADKNCGCGDRSEGRCFAGRYSVHHCCFTLVDCAPHRAEAVWEASAGPSDFLILPSITSMLLNPSSCSTIFPDRSTKNNVGIPSMPASDCMPSGRPPVSRRSMLPAARRSRGTL